MTLYDHKRIEKKWQAFWDKKNVFASEVDYSKPKYYILDMFPYPSGAGLHVGHVTGYTATDILARYKRQKGFNVLHPMGWDSFGLPAEQYAIRTGTHPEITTKKNIATYERQLRSLGLSYDWSRQVATSDPSYYKWTQWIFTKLYERGLAYEAEILVNYCPELGTVLANEEVENGFSKEGGFAVERRPLRQWVLKITAYAERLLDDLDTLDWPEHLKKLQTNWIGKSEGATIHFKVEGSDEKISVFTTRPDTLLGVTFLTVAPEHPLLSTLWTKEQEKNVRSYQKESASKGDLERTDQSKEKRGVFTGGYALHPASGAKIPIWVGDYVLGHYGTGAVMGVPAHDERDFAFASSYQIPIICVIDPDFAELTKETKEEISDLRLRILEGKKAWEGTGTLLAQKQTPNGLDLSHLSTREAKEKVLLWLEKNRCGERTLSYKLRDWLFSRQRYWGEPFPILHFADGSKRVLEVDELPLCPPELADFKPTSSGDSPLARIPSWVNIEDPKTHKRAKRETNTMPQWAGSCWYYLRFCDPHNSQKAWDSEKEKYWMPVDLYVGGVEHAVLHLLYARFWHKVLYDCGLVSTLEPFQTLRNQGLIIAKAYKFAKGGYVPEEEVEEREGKLYHTLTQELLSVQTDKMSKSKLNGVSPDEMVDEYGADALRLYEMFMGPFDKEKLWNTDAVSGCKRFLNRFYDLVFSEKVTEKETEQALKLGHRLVDAVEKDLEGLQFNTAIAKMMEFLNHFIPLEIYPRSVVKMVVQVLYPFAPHIAEEMWEHLDSSAKKEEGLTYAPFPKVDPSYLIDTTATYVVQVNGKVRGKWELPVDRSEAEILSLAQSEPKIAKYIQGEIKKVVFVPNKLLSIVVEE